MTEPDIGVRQELVFHSPLGIKHFLSRERLVVRGYLADNSAGRTLIALLQRFRTGGDYFFYKIQIGTYYLFSHISIPPRNL